MVAAAHHDVVHIQHATQFAPLIRKANPAVPIVVQLQAELFPQNNLRVIGRRLAAADLIVSASDHITHRTREQLPALADRCRTLYDGIEPADFRPLALLHPVEGGLAMAIAASSVGDQAYAILRVDAELDAWRTQTAIELYKREHKRLLIDLGGNWCLDCRVLAGIMELPELHTFLNRHFVIVSVNIGRFDTNGAIAAHYGITRRLDGVPAILAVDPVHDRLLNRDKLFALSDARHMTPQGLSDWLAQWAA